MKTADEAIRQAKHDRVDATLARARHLWDEFWAATSVDPPPVEWRMGRADGWHEVTDHAYGEYRDIPLRCAGPLAEAIEYENGLRWNNEYWWFPLSLVGLGERLDVQAEREQRIVEASAPRKRWWQR